MNSATVKTGRTVRFLLLFMLLAAVLFTACKEEEKTSKGKSREADSATPTSAQPTAEPTGDPTPILTKEPTPTATPEPTPILSGEILKSLAGTWYAHGLEGIEVDYFECKDDPWYDYRLKFDGETLYEICTRNRIIGDEGYGSIEKFVLRTSFTEEERQEYRKMGYGMENYLDSPTDLASGHLVYSGVDTVEDYTLFIVDVNTDGSLSTLYATVSDHGTFPVFTEGFYKREPVFPMGTYYEDYLGMWYCRSAARYYEDAITVEEEPFDIRLLFHEGGTVDAIATYDSITESHYRLRYEYEDFTEDEYAMYRKWDEAGIEVWGERQPGEALSAAEYGTNLLYDGRMVFSCYDAEYEGELLSVEWLEEFGLIGVTVYSYDPDENLESMTYFTFSRENPFPDQEGMMLTDYVGFWQNEDQKGSQYGWQINPSGTAMEITPDDGESIIYYENRTEASDGDPAWLSEDYDQAVTDFSDRYLVMFSRQAGPADGLVLFVYDLFCEGEPKLYVFRGEDILYFLEYGHIDQAVVYERQTGIER